MKLPELYATRYAEGDKSWDSLVKLFEAALAEGSNRERARIVKAMRSYHHDHIDDLGVLPTWDVLATYTNIAEGKDPSSR